MLAGQSQPCRKGCCALCRITLAGVLHFSEAAWHRHSSGQALTLSNQQQLINPAMNSSSQLHNTCTATWVTAVCLNMQCGCTDKSGCS